MIPLTYIKFILFALCVAAPGSKFVKSTKIDPPALRGLGNNELMITPPTDPSLPMKKPLHGNKKQHGQMNQDLAGTNDPPYCKLVSIFNCKLQKELYRYCIIEC